MTSASTDICLYYNARKLLVYWLLCALMAGVGAYTLVYAPADTGYYRLTLAWLGVILFGVFCLPAFTWLVFDRRPKIVINADGILFNAPVRHTQKGDVRNYFVAWHDIQHIEILGQSNKMWVFTLQSDNDKPAHIRLNLGLYRADYERTSALITQLHATPAEQRATALSSFHFEHAKKP